MKLSFEILSLQWLVSSIAVSIGSEAFAPSVLAARQQKKTPTIQRQQQSLQMAAEEGSDGQIEAVYAAKTISNFDRYKKTHAESIKDPAKYWGDLAKKELDWFSPFDENKILQGDLTKGDVRWFEGGKLNAAYNALDRHNPDDLAILWEGDEPDDVRKITFGEMLGKVSQIANALKAKGVFECGWGKRAKHGETLGRRYIHKYANDVIELFREGYYDKDKRRGPNRIREILQTKYPGSMDIPLESEIRMAISALMVKMKSGATLSIGGGTSGRGRKSSFPRILTVLINRIVAENPNVKPGAALPVLLESYAGYRSSYPIDEMPSDAKLRQKVSLQKQQYKKGVSLNTMLPPV